MLHWLKRFPRPVFFLVVFALFAAACTSAVPTSTATPRPTVAPTSFPAATVAPADAQAPAPGAATKASSVAVEGSGILGGDPDVNAGALIWQGYWLSQNHFGPFVMGSGMGIPFMPPMDMMQNAMEMVAQNPADPSQVPQNMMPLQAVYASGSSGLVNDPRNFDPTDLKAFRLDPSTFEKTIQVRAQAETMLKLTQWAHSFSNLHFGTPKDDFGALQRFIGMIVAMLSQMQGQYAMENLLDMEDGLYRDSDGNLDYTGNWVMLHTLSDVSLLTREGGRYMNPDSHPMFEGAATGLFKALQARDPESAREAAAAVRALVYRTWTAEDPAIGEAAMLKARSIADGKLVGFTSSDVVEQSAAIAGLISAGIATEDPKYLDAADQLFGSLSADFDGPTAYSTPRRYIEPTMWPGSSAASTT